jgi:type VI secretion system protein ImpA
MSPLDLDKLLQPISDDEPAGADLEYDPAYLAAFRTAEGSPARQMGDTVAAGEEPDWRSASELAVDLLNRTKDLRVAVLLTRALLRVQGLAGLDLGLALLNGLVERFWDQVHPKLDPEDDNDPTIRVNILLDLCSQDALLHALRTAPLVRSRVLGPVSFRDIEIAEGRASAPPDVKPLDAAAIHGIFTDCSLEDLQAGTAAASSALQRVTGLSDALGGRIRLDQMPSFDPLSALLTAIGRSLGAFLAERLPPESPTAGSQGATSGSGASPADRPSPGGAGGEIASRDDVVRAIDRICDYYSRCEPTSPVPLLLKRARRLATGTFLDIVRDLAPGALDEIEKVCGPETES